MRKQIVILLVIVALCALAAVPATASGGYVEGGAGAGCAFLGHNYMSGGNTAHAWTYDETSPDYWCQALMVQVRYKADGVWYTRSAKVASHFVSDYWTGADDSGGKHRGEYAGAWGALEYSY
jgi:hypothetical protein